MRMVNADLDCAEVSNCKIGIDDGQLVRTSRSTYDLSSGGAQAIGRQVVKLCWSVQHDKAGSGLGVMGSRYACRGTRQACRIQNRDLMP